MITLRVEVPYASFRKSYARSFANLPIAATCHRLWDVALTRRRALRAAAWACALPLHTSAYHSGTTTLRKLSRYKYGVPGKQGNLVTL